MKKILLFSTLTLALSAITFIALPQAGMLDHDFGNGGIVMYNSADVHDNANDLHVYEDSSILISGTQMASGYITAGILQKFLPNGDGDLSWGTDGAEFFVSRFHPEDSSDVGFGGDDKLYTCGTAGLGGMFNRDFLLSRFNYDSTPDLSFNSTGYVKTLIRPDWDEASAMAFAPNGKIVLAGFSSGFSTFDNYDRVLSRYFNDYAPPVFQADFSVDDTLVCEGYDASFTDESEGNVITWKWTFEGGTPTSSSIQNPVIAYNSIGIYDVKLVISNGLEEDSITKADYVNVIALPGQPDIPAGLTELCGSYSTDYTTASVIYANSYEWAVTPPEAGSFNGSSTTATFESSDTYTGVYSIKVRGINDCDNGPWSAELQCDLLLNPATFWLEGEGEYCTGTPGAELILDSSQLFVDYELYKDGVATGIIVAGTASPISFGNITDEGLYTALGYTDNCSENMYGQVWVHEIMAPGQATTPHGTNGTCYNDIDTYSTVPDPDVETYFWSLVPPEAGTLTQIYDTVLVAWETGFLGQASLSVHGENNCGPGPESNSLQITVFEPPAPVITGVQDACLNDEHIYSTPYVSGNGYLWVVEGGYVIDPYHTHEVTIWWTEVGTGSIIVVEMDLGGCTTVSEEYNIIVDECIGIDEFNNDAFRIYPNPASDIINIEIPASKKEKASLRICNSMGELIELLPIENGLEMIKINTSNYKQGLYYLQLIYGNSISFSSKFIIIQ